MNNFFITLLFIFISACHSAQHDEKKIKEVNIENVPHDFKVPRKIFDEIEDTVKDDAKQMHPIYYYIPLQVMLHSEDPSVIKSIPVKITFPNGGGELNLSEYLMNQGTFYLSFPGEQFDKLPTLESLYFISDTSHKTIDGEVHGLGCGKYINLKSQFADFQKDKFFKLNTTQDRYLYVVAGYYIFVFRNKNQIYLTHLKVTDSRFSDQFCSTLAIQ